MRLDSNLNNTVCLNCRNVGTLSQAEGLLRCPNCGYEYVVFENIPILLKDARPSLTASWHQHKIFIRENEERLEEVRDARGRQPARAALLDSASSRAVRLNSPQFTARLAAATPVHNVVPEAGRRS